MKPEKLLQSLKTTQDEALIEQIEQSHPADWDVQKGFAKSYRAYLRESKPTPHRRPVYRIAGALAGFALLTGAAAAVYLPLQRIDTVPPQEYSPAPTSETTTMTTTQTTVTEVTVKTTARTTSVTQTETAPTEITTFIPRTTALPSPAVTAVRETADPTEAICIAAPYTPETAVPMTAVFTLPARTEAVTAPATETPSAIEVCAPTTEAVTTPPTERAATRIEETSRPSLQYFRMEQSGISLSMELVFTGALSPSPAEFVLYHSEDESFTELDSSSSGTEMHSYSLTDETGAVYRIIQSVREEFSFRYDRGSYPEPVTISGHVGMFLLPLPGEMPYTALYWDDGSYTFYMTAWDARADRMQTLAESFAPITQTTDIREEESP